MAMVPLFLFLNACRKDDINKTAGIDTILEKRTEDCLPENYELNFCLGSYFESKTIVLNNVQGYSSSCTFTVRYEYKWCKVGEGHLDELQVLIKNVDILEIDCPQYDQDIADFINNPCMNCPTIEDYIFQMEEKLQRLIEVDIFNFLLSRGFNLDCPFGSGWIPVTMKFTQYSCHTYCLLWLPKAGGGWYKPRRIACDNFVCCIVDTWMCYDTGLDKIVTSVSKVKQWWPEPPACVIPFSSTMFCNYYTSSCIDACEN